MYAGEASLTLFSSTAELTDGANRAIAASARSTEDAGVAVLPPGFAEQLPTIIQQTRPNGWRAYKVALDGSPGCVLFTSFAMRS